jgi:hypothetical protein
MEQSDAARRSVAERIASGDLGREGIVTSRTCWRGCLVHRASMLSLVSVLCTGSVGAVGAQAGVIVAKAVPVAYWRTNLASESVDSLARMAVARTPRAESVSGIVSSIARSGVGSTFRIGPPAPQAPSPPPIQVDSARRDSHVAAGVLIGFAAGAALGEYRAHHDAGCAGHSDCEAAYGPIPYPIAFGVAGGVVGGIVAWLWSQR